MARILISGTSGFIAPVLAEKLDEQGHDVYCLERYVSGRYSLGGKRLLKTLFADLNDHFAIRHLIRTYQPEVVYHLAALSPVSYSYDRPQEVLNTNYLATVNLAETCMREDSNLKQFVFASSSEAYGNQTVFPIPETASYKPNSPYSCSKVAAVEYLQYLYETYEFPATIALPFNSYGRKNSTHFIVERCMSQMLNDAKEVHLGDPEPVRDLMFVSDHVEAYLKMLNKEDALGQKINVCTGEGVRIDELAHLIAKITGFHGATVWSTIPQRPNDIMKLVGCNAKAKKLLNWTPKISLEQGLKKTYDMLRGVD